MESDSEDTLRVDRDGVNFGELRDEVVRRIYILGTPVNRDL